MKKLFAALIVCLIYATAWSAAAQDTVRIGVVNEITGPSAEQGLFNVNGVKLAVDEVNANGGLLGKKIELRIEDNLSTNPGTVLAFSKLSGDKTLAGIIGPIRSTQIQAASPTIAKAGIPTMIGGSDMSLTHVNNRWVFRCRPHDGYSSRVIADFGSNMLGLKKWAIVHSTDAFGAGGKTALVAALKAIGIEPVLVQGYTPGAQDFTAAVLAVKKSGADIMGTYMAFPPDQGIFAKQLRQLGVNIAWVGSATTIAVSTLNLAGEALHGSYAVVDYTFDANPQSKAFAKRYRERYGINPDSFAAWAYDATLVLALAIKNAGTTEAEAVRKAILSIRGYEGVEGRYQFDENGDGLHGYSVVKNEKGKIVFIKRVEFPPK